VLLVNEALARRYWPAAGSAGPAAGTGAATAWSSPVGRRVRLGGNDANPYATIVGVVADARSESLGREPVPELYLPFAQAAALMGSGRPRQLTVTVRTAGDPVALAGALRGVVARLDPELPIASLRTMEEVRSRSLATTRFATLALGGFGALAVVLGAVGIFGVVSYLAGERRREIGIRIALGARRRSVLALVLRQGVLPALVGILAGVVGALATTRVLATLLFEVEPGDPLTLVAVAASFGLVAALASWAPARRASRLDPAVVLRDE
jgi:predicted lysophospholipase L1 biosynthesis ABC-type transport system permease subunit